jgi:hypothetical protein
VRKLAERTTDSDSRPRQPAPHAARCASWLRWLNGFMSCCWRRVETTPVLWKGKLLRFESVRGNYGEEPKCPTCGLGKRTHLFKSTGRLPARTAQPAVQYS